MTLLAYLAGSDRAYKIRLSTIGLTSNSDGSTGTGGIIFDDEEKTLTVRGWMYVKVLEDDCTAAPVLFTGFIGPRSYVRNGPTGTYRDGDARWINCDVVDQNILSTIRIITGPDGKRPAETHNHRINWLLGSDYVDGLFVDTGEVDNSHPRPFDAADYRGQVPQDVLNDLAGPIFKTFFIHPTQPTAAEQSLFFDSPDATTGTSTLSISNVQSDVDYATCFPPLIDAELRRDPSAVVAKVRYVGTRGAIIENDNTTYNTFFSAAATGGPDLGYRGLNVENSRVSSIATARLMADGILARESKENDTIHVSVLLPSSKVGLIDIGQRLQVRFQHIDGYESFTYTRVVVRTITQPGLTDGSGEMTYQVDLELNAHGVSGTGGGGAPPPGDFPPPGTPGLVQPIQAIVRRNGTSGTGNLNTYPGGTHSWTAPTPGNLLVLGVSAYDNASGETIPIPSGWTAATATYHPDAGGPHPEWAGRLFYKLADGSETIGDVASGFDEETVGLAEFDGGATLVGSVTGGGAYGPLGSHSSDQGNRSPTYSAIATTSGEPVALVGWWSQTGETGVWTNPWGGTIDQAGGFELGHPSSGGGGIGSALVFAPVDSSSGSERLSGTMYDNDNAPFWAVAAFRGLTSDTPPSPGQQVLWETVTMSTSGGVSVGTTANSYAAGSLQVKVDGVLISPSQFTETDPTTGDFALSWQIDPDETVTVSYQAGSGPKVTTVTLTSADSEATFVAKTNDMNIDKILLAAGTYTWDDVEIDVDRTARPLTISPVPGATVTFVGNGSTSGGIFFFGLNSQTSWITMDGTDGRFVFDGISLAQAGVFEIRSSSHCTIQGITARNLVRDGAVPGSQPYKSWVGYISMGSGVRNNANLVLDDWILEAPAVNRDVSAIQVASSGLTNDLISITNVTADQYHYAFYDEVAVTSLTLDGWTLSDCGHSAGPYSILFTAVSINGVYRNIVATTSDPLVNNSTGTMIDGGGNSGI